MIKNKTIKQDYEKMVKDFLSLNNSNKMIILNLIDVIYLNEKGNIEIYYKIQNPYK